MLGVIGSIALLVGGIGIMNVMLASVAERHREIGIRITIGASQRDILMLFLIEASCLAAFGGTLGILLGTAIAFCISYFAHWGFSLYFLPIIVGFFVSTSTGVFFGFYPAYRASRLNPIDTLRYE